MKKKITPIALSFLMVILIYACKKKEEVKPPPSVVKGCMDSTAINYNPNATVSDTCIYAQISGCMDSTASNYNPDATVSDTCIYAQVSGCMDSTASNFNPNATVSDTCIYDNFQSTWEKVYIIFQPNCTFSACHDNTPSPGLQTLQGTGSTLADSMEAVYNNIFNQIPFNDSAQSKGYRLIYPGDYYRSFLFRKINNGFVADISLDVGEGCPMPKTSTCSIPIFPLDTNDIELIRQWILSGALDTGIVRIAETGLNSQ